MLVCTQIHIGGIHVQPLIKYLAVVTVPAVMSVYSTVSDTEHPASDWDYAESLDSTFTAGSVENEMTPREMWETIPELDSHITIDITD